VDLPRDVRCAGRLSLKLWIFARIFVIVYVLNGGDSCAQASCKLGQTHPTGQNYIGSYLDERLRDQMQMEFSASFVRVLYPDTAATSDYRENRVTILVDKLRRVLNVLCG
jgi:hypothetical protein